VVTVEGVEASAGSQVMFDLTVNNVHNYYVEAGSVSLLVHNCGDNFGISKEAENISKHANENAYRAGNGLDHNIPGVSPEALDVYVDGILEGKVPGVEARFAENGRSIYWDPSKGSVVVVDGSGGGSVYVPTDGYSYFKSFKL
jgi:hypothetical protein